MKCVSWFLFRSNHVHPVFQWEPLVCLPDMTGVLTCGQSAASLVNSSTAHLCFPVRMTSSSSAVFFVCWEPLTTRCGRVWPRSQIITRSAFRISHHSDSMMSCQTPVQRQFLSLNLFWSTRRRIALPRPTPCFTITSSWSHCQHITPSCLYRHDSVAMGTADKIALALMYHLISRLSPHRF